LLVEQAVSFENTVKNMRVNAKVNKKSGGGAAAAGSGAFITWDNAEELETYISKIQEAVNGISNENRRLRKIH
jgi:hypothetical protein